MLSNDKRTMLADMLGVKSRDVERVEIQLIVEDELIEDLSFDEYIRVISSRINNSR
ncbi:hypothetical protein [Vibrio chagasii]|uniref:hypothetical protein n=1 Tax=Vibrio chagasii TaxID=170679 RepID=UPI00338C1F57|nr:hypothetical protein VCHA34O109_180069 [Vibrio chagasii]